MSHHAWPHTSFYSLQHGNILLSLGFFPLSTEGTAALLWQPHYQQIFREQLLHLLDPVQKEVYTKYHLNSAQRQDLKMDALKLGVVVHVCDPSIQS
jgi:hypothetical protein